MKPLILVPCLVLGLGAQSVAFTFDDGPKMGATPLMTPQQRNAAMLKALAEQHLRAALFVTSGNGANKAEGFALLKAWGEAGHMIGNHTVTHPDLNAKTTTLKAYEDEVLACDAVIHTVPGYRKFFRFTFLREGDTPEKRDGMRAFLNARGYRNAYVTIDTSDWRLDQRLNEKLAANPGLDVAPYRDMYLSHLAQRAEAYQALSQKLLGRQIPQVLLLHHNLLNALFLGDALTLFKAKGWTFVDPEKAFADPVYQLRPERPAPGQSLLLSLARSRGEDLKAYDRLMDDGDFEIAELEKQGN